MNTNKSHKDEQPYRFVVDTPSQLSEFLRTHLPHLSHNRIADTLRGGGVTVEGRVVSAYNHPLIPGQTVCFSRSRAQSSNTPHLSPLLEIVYQDADIAVVLKGPGLLSAPAGVRQQCVKKMLDDYFERSRMRARSHVVHRLDRDTSGLLVYAKTAKAWQILTRDWYSIVTDRRYAAVVCGRPRPEEGTIQSFLTDRNTHVTTSPHRTPQSKPAETHYRTLASNPLYSLVELKLQTGRKHQIRVHMASIGCPVLGDPLYNPEGTDVNPLRRMALHAYKLYFYHPLTGAPLQFETPIPAAFTKLFK